MKTIQIIPLLCFITITGIAESIKTHSYQKRNPGTESEMIEAEESAETFEYGELDEDIRREKQKMENKNIKNKKQKKSE